MKIYFASINVPDSIGYISKKLNCAPQTISPIISGKECKSILDIVEKDLYEKEYKNLSPDRIKMLRERQACGIKYINSQYPLLAEEHVEEDFFTYLEKQTEEYPKGTPVLFRRTNMAETYYMFDLHAWTDNEVVLNEPIEVRSKVSRNKSTFLDMGEKLIVSLLKGLAGKAGGEVFELIFPKTHFELDYDNIKKIVNTEITNTVISEIDGEMNGVINYMKTGYKAEVKKGTSGSNLINIILQPQAMKMSGLVEKLAVDQFKEPGFAAYMVAVGVYLALYQEMAILDKGKENYKQSSYYTDSMLPIISRAKAHITETILIIQTKRKAMVKIGYGTSCRPNCAGVEFYSYYRWDDAFDGAYGYFEKEKGNNAEQRRNESFNRRQQYVSDNCTQELKVHEVLDSLNALI